jgi:hypothetical protein
VPTQIVRTDLQINDRVYPMDFRASVSADLFIGAPLGARARQDKGQNIGLFFGRFPHDGAPASGGRGFMM